MKTLGRIFFLLLAIVTGLWFARSVAVVFFAFGNPDAVPAAIGAAVLPLLFCIVCVSCFRKLAPTRKA